MSYKLNKTDGSLLVDLVDGQLDTTSSDLTLIGRNYSGFGEVLNENFIQLLENFANSAAPTSPVRLNVVAVVNLFACPAVPDTVPLTLPVTFPTKLFA